MGDNQIMREISIPAGHVHTHHGEKHYGPKTISIPAEDANTVAHLIVEQRAEKREKAKKIPGSPESENAKEDAAK